MITIQFLKDHVTADGQPRHKGEVAAVSLSVGTELVLKGIAKERPPEGPTEHKEEP
jgi:hypothetical protein